MPYHESELDKKLSKWFLHDNSKQLLRSIFLTGGQIRALMPFQIEFNFPISVIAGKNGSGKSTLLAIAACAHHGEKKKSQLTNRKVSYYTFSDFLIQSIDEVPPEGIQIYYGIAYNQWAPTKTDATTEGVFFQSLRKEKGGKWSNYSDRIPRTTVFFGIDRVVPHSEKSVSKSYRNAFSNITVSGCENAVQESVSKVMGTKYEEFHFKRHSKYKLPLVKRSEAVYSGFNMGAGENALFEIFFVLHSCPDGTLVLIDEIELGLHAQAQKRLISELKEVCLAKKLQVICTTHSPNILEEVPLDARFYLENGTGKTNVINGISSGFATGKLLGRNSEELTIYVEDDVARDIINGSLPHDLRSRISVISIGSDSAIISLMAALRKEGKRQNILGILDGDKYAELPAKYELFIRRLESYASRTDETTWIRERLIALPGGTWPEKWMLSVLKTSLHSEILGLLQAPQTTVMESINQAELAGKHNEFHELSMGLHIDKDHLRKIICSHIAKVANGDFAPILEKISKSLQLLS